MSLRTYSATAIDCDGSGPYGNGCHRSYAAPYSLTGAHLVEGATRFDGWTERDGKHFCPDCSRDLPAAEEANARCRVA